MRDGKVDVFFALGGNFVAATPDSMSMVHASRPWPPSSDFVQASGSSRYSRQDGIRWISSGQSMHSR
jgi:hypothetical protein